MRKKTKRTLIIVISVILAILLLLAGTFAFMYYRGKSQFHKNDGNIKTDTVVLNDDDIEYGGKIYSLNKNIVSILFIGVDKQNINSNFGYGMNGQADSLFVMAIDTLNKTVKLIPISRETMVDVDLYDNGGQYAGIKKEQLCLAYAYGNTAEQSSKNVLKSVRRALFDINISSYVTIDLMGVSRMTVKMGGVTLDCLEELKINGKIRPVGETLMLKGQSAVDYIQMRGDDEQANNRRMARQQQFLSAFASEVGNQIMDDFSKLTTYYNAMKPYMSTDLSFS
ncbi:MAG: LCP family protein [Clostridia bacterium]|nr:LCP family protein [Clostridia bacterium]